MHSEQALLVVLFLLQCGTQSGSTQIYQRCVTDESTTSCMVNEIEVLNAYPVKQVVIEGQTVEVYAECQQNSSGELRCHCHQRINSTRSPLQHNVRYENGAYTVICSNYSVSVTWSLQRRPSAPVIKAMAIPDRKNMVQLNCMSEENPKPNIKWNTGSPTSCNQNYKGESTVLSCPGTDMKCCASNSLGEECSAVHDYDLHSVDKHKDQIFLRSGQSLLLRCKIKSSDPELKWFFNNTAVQGCVSFLWENWMEHLSIQRVNVAHSGEYICKSNSIHSVNVHVKVFEHDQIDILQLNENNSIAVQNKTSFCFQAQVFSHPKVQCHWITPNHTKIKCEETNYSNYTSTFKLCNPESGEYQMKLDTQEYSVIRNLSLCISDIPRINIDKNSSSITCTTQSSTPTALSWKICPSPDKCTNPEDWKEIPVDLSEFPDADGFCEKNIVFVRPRSNNENHHIKCCITNLAGSHCSNQILLQTYSYTEFIICFAVMFVLLMIIIALIIFIRVKKPVYECQIQMIQMVGPNDNDYIYIDFRDFKYDLKWEFPRENLELGQTLGSGAFGMVVQATAYGISKPGVSIQVAVKMLKDKHQAVEKEALMSELKMLTYIGHHENIVNLLGACTGTGPIYLIFQYCCNGDLLNYLKCNREHFHKYLTDAFNRDRFRGLYHNFQQKRNSSEFVGSNDNPCMHIMPETKDQEDEALLSPSISSVSTTEEILKCDSEQEEELQSLTYDDLLSFSFQVAKGMEFLSAKNCIHRDLAARNILVTQGRQVKIGDFGLARDIECDSNYVVRGNVRLPVKWMAPESIFKGVYTMQSDVWAYGILLWEIFSLGVTPYPGVPVNSSFYRMIESGYHMEQPYYALESIYQVMCRCWSLDPADRPCFSKLVAFMNKELADLEERLYYNFEEYCYNNTIYQNAPVTLDASSECQSSPVSTDNADESKAVEDPGSVRTEPDV